MKDKYTKEIDFTDKIIAYGGGVKLKKDGSPVKKTKKRQTKKGEYRDKDGDLKKTSADEKAGYPPNCNEGYEEKDGKCVPVKKDEANLQMGYPQKKPMMAQTQNEFVLDCMCNPTLKEEFSHQEQRHAVCYSKWRQAKRKAKGSHICWNEEEENYFSYIIY